MPKLLKIIVTSQFNRKHINNFRGIYEYKFIIYNQWLHDPSLPSVQNQHGSFNNIINIKRKLMVSSLKMV